MKEMKRFLSLFLCLVMLVGYLPANAFADEVAQTQQATQPVVETVAEDSADETGSADETATNPEETTVDETTPDEGAVIPGESTDATEGEDVVPGGDGADEEEIPEETEAKKPVRPGRPVIVQQVTDEAMSGDTAMIADDVNPDATIVIAASDYQKSNTNPKTNVSNILTKIKAAGYDSADGFLFGGDYTQSMGSSTDTKNGKEELQKAVQEVYGMDMDEIYVQGNHDPDSAVGSTLTASGARDTDDYGVYVINQKDYPWGYGSYDMKTVTKATADALDDYLDDKADEGYGKPIFVITHLPLHITSRNSQGDGTYAKYLYDVLDEAGDKGLNIIFMFGHNHSSTYDDYIGGGAIYLAKGSTISIAKEGSTSSYFTDELSFTYMNCGYVGYSRSSADNAMTMTLFEITDDEVVVKRYDANGLHNLKAKGTGTGYPNVDTTVVETDTITLTTPTTGEDDEDDVTVPTQPSEPEGDKTVTDASGKVSVTAPGVTAVIVNKSTLDGVDTSAYSAYARYDITLEGYTHGDEATVTIQLDDADGFRNGAAVVLDVEKNVTIDAVIANGAVTFKTTHFSEYDVMQTAETGEGAAGNWTLISDGSGKTFYTLDTDGIDSGAKYLIVAESYAKALTAASSNNNSSDVTIDGNTITTDDASYGWTFTSSGSGYTIQNNGGTYLGRSSSSIAAGSDSSVWTVSNEKDGKYNITQSDSGSSWWGGSSTYYVRWSNYSGYFQASSSSQDPVRLYKYDRTESAGYAVYAQMSGTMSHAVPVGTAEDTVLAAVLSGISVQTSADAAGTNPEPGDASKIAVNWETEYDAEAAGTYNAVVTYDGVEIGTVAVTVRKVTISGITVNPASGTVTVGASGAALVGATITVHVADEGFEDYTVPVTVGMLSGEGFSTDAVGTYENLTVTYMGKTDGGFTLNVKEKVVNNYPSYPNEGAVKVDKTAHGIDFQKTGVAQVELTASGVPMNQGVDVVIMLDTSSSMTRSITVNGKSVKRIDLLRPAVNELIEQLQTKRPDGSNPDIDIVIASFNGNTIDSSNNYISDDSSKPTMSGTSTDNCGVLTGQKTVGTGWVDIMSLSTEWGSSETNLPTGSGTNYDYGLELVYELLEQKQSDNGDNTRKQFVLFMSDGAPSQYNGAWSNDGEAEFSNWLLGNYDETDASTTNDIPDSVSATNKTFYTGYRAGKGQLHRAAEAIKGSPDNSFAYVTYNSSGVGSLKTVNGLGATVYSIGLLLQDVSGGTRTAEDQQTVLNTIASSEDLAISITTVEGLGETFTRFGNDVLYAAENAFFADELGPNFNIQLASTTKRLVDGEVFPLNPAPAMEVREYTIWTRAELEDANGNLSEANAKKVGTRKTDNDGDFIYNTIEKVTFNADGTEAYLNDDTTKNVMVNNVINAKTFWYNNSTASVWIDKDGNAANGNEYELKPETFLWKVGTINTKEIALSYYVYLDDSLEGEASAGSYETNKYAILSYDNYLGNPCTKETVSPQMAWLSANVSYAYYLVNKAGQPVNANGEVVTFANREVIVNPTNAGEIKLNSIVDVESLKIASTGVLDDGSYALYDYDAEYELSVNSDATGAWEITVGAGKPATTYVTGFSSTVPFTNAITSTSAADNYDYTHTTVWFAVVWEPRAVEDTVVIDYGLPVDVHVLTNDFFGDFGTLVGVAEGTVTNSDNNISTNVILASETPAAGTYGKAQVIKPDTGANESNSVIRYTLENMEMHEPEVFTYSVEYTNTKLHNNNGFYYGSLTVIPATTVYYEDSFLTLAGYGGAQWEQEGPSNAVQDEDRPDDINFAFDTVIDANNVYGYDSNYTNCSTHSLGSAAKINVSQGAYGTAEFTFYGTGFDIISLTSATTGIIVVDVYKDGEKYLSETVDTYYGAKITGYKEITYVYNAEAKVWNKVVGETKSERGVNGTRPTSPKNGDKYVVYEAVWETTASDDTNALYQIPVMKIGDGKTTEKLPYGKYTAKITATYVPFLDHNKTDTGYNFYLDAIRIYNPAGTTYGNDGEIDKDIQDAYKADGEAYPEYFEVREQIISVNDFNANADAVAPGIVFIDGAIEEPSIADYTSYGPNNEVYLAAGQAIAFDLVADPTGGLSKVQLALKSVGGTASAKVYATDGTTALDADITTATDMYYDITALNGKTVVIMNDGASGILSITNVKVTYTEDQPDEPAEPIDVFRISKSSANAALATMIVAEEPEVPETSEPVVEETEAPETSVPETSEPETSEPEETEPEETKPESSKDKMEQALAKAAAQAAKIAQNMKKAAEQAAKTLSKLFSKWF